MINTIASLFLLVASYVVLVQHQSVTDIDLIYLQIWIGMSLVIAIASLLSWALSFFAEESLFPKGVKIFSNYLFKFAVFFFIFSGLFVLNDMTPIGDQKIEAGTVESIQYFHVPWDIAGFENHLPSRATLQMDNGPKVDIWLKSEDRARFWQGQRIFLHTHEGPFLFQSISKIEQNDQGEDFRALKADPMNRKAWQRLIVSQQQQDYVDEVFRFSISYAKYFPGDPFLKDIAKWLLELRKSKEVIQLMTGYVKQRPKDFEALNYLGISLARNNQFNEAISFLKYAEALAPLDYWPQYHLGYTYYYMGQNHLALEYFRKVMQKRRKFPEVQNLLNQLARYPAQK